MPIKKKILKKKKQIGLYYAKIRSRHPSHNILRRDKQLRFTTPVVVRFGSTTAVPQGFIEINRADAIMNSASKLRMKQCFTAAGVQQANWFLLRKQNNNYLLIPKLGENLNEVSIANEAVKYPLVLKHIYGSRNKGNSLIKCPVEFKAKLDTIPENKFNNYIVEEFFSGEREYRLHVTRHGCFYTCRKALKQDVQEDKKWFRNDSNSVWLLEENPAFNKPVNWNAIIEECVKALNAVGLDFGAVDLRVQSANTKKGKVRENPIFKVIEINSAPSFGEVTSVKYKEEIIKIVNERI